MAQRIYVKTSYVPLVSLIPLADEHGARLVFDFIDHHPLTAGVQLHEIATPK